MRALVIGYGSIGARHARLLIEHGVDVVCVSNNISCPFPRYTIIAEALDIWRPDRIVVANPTANHGKTIADLDAADYTGPVLVEKPVFSSPEEMPPSCRMTIYVAYNLRFHPLVRRLKELISDIPLYTASLHAGQYLPQWRPGSDYRNCYSAKSEQGGGVLRDLSHELDLSTWLCGSWNRVAALGGQFSDLEIASDDVFSLLTVNERCPAVTVTVNYLDRMARRTITVNGRGLTATLDLVGGRFVVNGDIVESTFPRDVTYVAQLSAFLEGDSTILCTLEEGLEVTRLVTAAERAAENGTWVNR